MMLNNGYDGIEFSRAVAKWRTQSLKVLEVNVFGVLGGRANAWRNNKQKGRKQLHSHQNHDLLDGCLLGAAKLCFAFPSVSPAHAARRSHCEAELRGHVRSQVKLGNEEKPGDVPDSGALAGKRLLRFARNEGCFRGHCERSEAIACPRRRVPPAHAGTKTGRPDGIV